MRRKHWLKDLSSAISSPNYTGFAACFSPLSVLTRPKLRLRSAKLLKPRGSRSRFRCRNAQEQPTKNTAARKRVRQEDADSAYLFGNFSQRNLRPPGF